MILAEIDLTATKILTPGLFRYRSIGRLPGAGRRAAGRVAGRVAPDGANL
jgi:hypothetical protein